MKEDSKLLFALDILVNLVVIIVLAILIRTYLVSPFHVFGPSMCNTLNYIEDECIDNYGEYIIVNEAAYQSFFGLRFSEPKNGDIVIFQPPGDKDQYYVKRVIGIPGDTIKIENGYVERLVNGEYQPIDESTYLNEDSLGKTYVTGEGPFIYKVPEGKYFVLGDNRNRSTDSRNCFRSVFPIECSGETDTAYITLESIRGKAWVVFWPLSNFRLL